MKFYLKYLILFFCTMNILSCGQKNNQPTKAKVMNQKTIIGIIGACRRHAWQKVGKSRL